MGRPLRLVDAGHQHAPGGVAAELDFTDVKSNFAAGL